MADIEKGLPVRTEDDADQYVRVKLADPTTPTQMTEVDSDGNAHVEVHGNRADDSADVALELSEQGKPNGRGDYEADDNSEPNSSGLVAGIRAAGNVATDQTEHITSIQDSAGTRRALDVAIHDEAGEPFSVLNPIPVVVSSDGEGTEVQDFSEGASIATAGTSNHDYSVADTDVFLLKRVIGAASGRGKYTLQIGDGAASEAFTDKAIQFGTEANPNVVFEFTGAPLVVTGTVNTTTVRVVRQNRDNEDAQDIHSTIIGVTL